MPQWQTKAQKMKTNKGTAPDREGYIKTERPSALSLWVAAAVWAFFGLLMPMYMWYHYLICAALSIIAGAVTARLAPPVVTYEKAPVSTGKPELDEAIEALAEVTDSLAAVEATGSDCAPTVRRISDTLASIEAELRRDPDKLDGLRRLFGYYLPTAKKLSDKYICFKEGSENGAVAAERSAAEIEAAFSLIADAVSKFYDSLFEEDALDISTDVDVLEAMLRKDGLN